MPVPLTALLKFFVHRRKSSGWPFSKVTFFNLYVSEAVYDGFRRILILMMSYLLDFGDSFFIIGIGGGLIRAWNYALSQPRKLFMF